MIDRLKDLIDMSEDKPKIKELLLNVARLPENKQEDALKLIEIILSTYKNDIEFPKLK